MDPYVIHPKQHTVWQNRDIYSSLLCGALAGIAAKTVIAPAERVKMSFQISSDKFTFSEAGKRAMMMVRKEGILSLWKGHSTTILRVAPYSGLNYAFHDLAEKLFKITLKTDKLPASCKFLSGSIGGFVATILTYPLDVLRVRLAIGSTWKASIMQGGFFQGIFPTIAGIIPYSGVAWLSKQTMTEAFPDIFHRHPSIPESLAINAAAG